MSQDRNDGVEDVEEARLMRRVLSSLKDEEDDAVGGDDLGGGGRGEEVLQQHWHVLQHRRDDLEQHQVQILH